MLNTIGQGLICNAILQSGFTCTYTDFDSARFTNQSPDKITLHVTTEILQDINMSAGVCDSLLMLDSRLKPVGAALIADGAWFEFPPPEDQAIAIFSRIDKPTCLGRTWAIKVTVRAYNR